MIIESIIVLGALGLVFGLMLAFFSRKFKVDEDPRISRVIKVLPGTNCGACGYAGCSDYAKAVTESRDVPIGLCVLGQKETAEKIGKILERKIERETVQLAALLKCKGGRKETRKAFNYEGIRMCKAASSINRWPSSCSYGCIGLGDCVKSCKFDALKIGDDGLPVVDREKCVGCGACVKACPNSLFKLVPKDKNIHVLCSSKDLAKDVIASCSVGCIACKACERACPEDAIHVNGNIAEIDYSKCTQCGKCVIACPMNIIVDVGIKGKP
ncbi:Fe-S cluster domain-containing protein [Candidatus Woesearchaeota archaeon]|nr:Fe-S cluster domain-containing protein [Candidatus Woesearchaeota archaeon]